MVALLEEIHTRPRALLDAVAAADARTVARGREGNPARREVVLSTELGDSAGTFAFKGVVTRREGSPITGGLVERYTTAPWDTLVPLYRTQRAVLTVRQPVGYLIPQEWTAAIDRLALHGIAFRRFRAPWRDSVDVQHVLAWQPDKPTEGHRPLQVTKVTLESRLREYRPGDVWVPLDQRAGLVAVHLFEAQAPDGLMRWNFFDTVFDPKEYAEADLMEPIARQMLTADSRLRQEFETKLRADTAFAHDPQARIDFFYRRSKWADPEWNVHPVARARHAPPETVLGPP
jgi:hypothetical protein